MENSNDSSSSLMTSNDLKKKFEELRDFVNQLTNEKKKVRKNIFKNSLCASFF